MENKKHRKKIFADSIDLFYLLQGRSQKITKAKMIKSDYLNPKKP